MSDVQSMPCRVCGVAVHGDHDGKGYRAGSYKFAVCLTHVETIERTRSAAISAARTAATNLFTRKFPRLAQAVSAVREISLNEEVHE